MFIVVYKTCFLECNQLEREVSDWASRTWLSAVNPKSISS